MIAAEFTSADLAMLVVILVLLVVLGVPRPRRDRAHPDEQGQGHGARRGAAAAGPQPCCGSSSSPSGSSTRCCWSCSLCQLVQRDARRRPGRAALRRVRVIDRDRSSTSCSCSCSPRRRRRRGRCSIPERSALFAARPVAALVPLPAARGISRGLIGLTNVILPGKGLKQGRSCRRRSCSPCRRRGRGGGDRARGARSSSSRSSSSATPSCAR